MRLFTGLCLFGLAGGAANPSSPASGRYHVSGGLKGVGGSRLPAAQVQLLPLGKDEPLARADAAAGGRFFLVAPGPGDYRLRFLSPGYPSREVYLQILPDAREVSLETTLEPYDLPEKPLEPVVVGEWNELDFARAEPMQAQPDGTWVLERAVPGERAAYVFQGIAQDDRPGMGRKSFSDGASCLQAKHFTLRDKWGIYLCDVPVKEGRVRIVLDPRTLPRAAGPTPLQVTFAPPYTFLNPLNALHARARTQSVLAWRTKKAYDHGALPGEMLAFIRDPAQPRLARQLVAMDLLLLSGHSLASASPEDKGRALARELLEVLPTDSPLWGLSIESTMAIMKPVLALKPGEQLQIYKDFAERNPEPLAKAYALSSLIDKALEDGDLPRAAALVERVKPLENFFATSAISNYKKVAESLKGKPAPAFSAPLMGSTQSVSRESLLGRFYLIDFWATWCVPCVQEIPALRTALEKFKDRGGFTLLSVSMDMKLEMVRRYQEDTQPMPWMNVFNGPDFKAPLIKAFDVSSLPRIFLVDAAGQVVATDKELRGKKLEETLDKLLPPTSPASAAGGARRTAD